MAVGPAVGGALFGMVAILFIQALLPSFNFQTGGAATSGRRLLGLATPHTSAVQAAGEVGPLASSGQKRNQAMLQQDGAAGWPGVMPFNIFDLQIPMVHNPHYGIHLVVLGQNGSLYHRFQTGPTNTSALMPYIPMSDWHVLTPDPTLFWGNSPAIALNADGRIELIVGNTNGSLDLWQMYQTDPKDPLAWSKPRPPSCDPLGPPADPACIKCINAPPSDPCNDAFWTTEYAWATSEQWLWLDPSDNKLKLYWRSFTNEIYVMSQKEPSNSKQWDADCISLGGVYM